MSKKRIESIISIDESLRNEPYGAVVPPIYQNSLFAFKDWDSIDKAFDEFSTSMIYSRINNPTAIAAEEKIAALCHGEKAKLTASGMAAISAAILHVVKANDHIITIHSVYGPANSFMGSYLKDKSNIDTTYVRGTSVQEFADAIRPNTTLIYLESPASMTYEMQDLKAIAKLAKKHGIKTIIDNTWATPLYQHPLDLGIDIEIHSVSKYICGHSDVVAGVIVSDQETIDAIIRKEYALLGGKIAPFEAWLILRSLRTLPARMHQHQANAKKIAQYLEGHKKIREVLYPGLESFEQYKLGKKQMSGYTGLLSFELDTDRMEEVKEFVNTLQLFHIGVSWGGHESLIYSPSISYAKELPPEKFKAMGIKVGLVRISVGLEHQKDLIKDLKNALKVLS